MDELLADPLSHVLLVQTRLAAASGREPSAVEVRVAASVAHLGLVARLISPVLGAAALTGESRSAGPLDIWWQPERGGAFPLSLSRACDVVSLLEGPVQELSDAFARLRVSLQILRGNVASAVNGAATAIGRSAASQLAGGQPGRRAREIAASVYGHPALRGAATFAADGASFRRRNCCLIYRAAPPGTGTLCGDCVLSSAPTL
jgi:hypothetical protein